MADPYELFLRSKAVKTPPRGFDPRPVNESLFGYQRDVVQFAIRQGSAALFMDTGLGKTACELEWCNQIVEHTNAPTLILTPLAVAAQTAREAGKFGYDARVVRSADEVRPGINITNYDRMDRFDVSVFAGVALDESSILKNFTGKTRNMLVQSFRDTPYKLAATATPSPNDHTELGNHSEFLGVLNHCDMLPRWFINDTADTGEWRLKGHAVKPFWDWVSSWSRCVSRPSDIGHSDDGFILPPIEMIQYEIPFHREAGEFDLFHVPDLSATGIHREKRASMDVRAAKLAEVINDDSETWVVWVETDYEADAIMAVLKDAIELRGSDSIEKKERVLEQFSNGEIRVLVTKPSIAGFGMNWQHCARTAFVGVSYSYEMFYQAVRRFWRFGQKRSVQVHVAMTSVEQQIWAAVAEKSASHDDLKREMREAMQRNAMTKQTVRNIYVPQQQAILPPWLRNAT